MDSGELLTSSAGNQIEWQLARFGRLAPTKNVLDQIFQLYSVDLQSKLSNFTASAS